MYLYKRVGHGRRSSTSVTTSQSHVNPRTRNDKTVDQPECNVSVSQRKIIILRREFFARNECFLSDRRRCRRFSQSESNRLLENRNRSGCYRVFGRNGLAGAERNLAMTFPDGPSPPVWEHLRDGGLPFFLRLIETSTGERLLGVTDPLAPPSGSAVKSRAFWPTHLTVSSFRPIPRPRRPR